MASLLSLGREAEEELVRPFPVPQNRAVLPLLRKAPTSSNLSALDRLCLEPAIKVA